METYFTKEHEWVRSKEGIAGVGISEHAAHELGDITFVELPQVGKTVKQFDVLAEHRIGQGCQRYLCPAFRQGDQGERGLEVTPEIVNESAEEAGWMAWLEIADDSELKNLMSRSSMKNT